MGDSKDLGGVFVFVHCEMCSPQYRVNCGMHWCCFVNFVNCERVIVDLVVPPSIRLC